MPSSLLCWWYIIINVDFLNKLSTSNYVHPFSMNDTCITGLLILAKAEKHSVVSTSCEVVIIVTFFCTSRLVPRPCGRGKIGAIPCFIVSSIAWEYNALLNITRVFPIQQVRLKLSPLLYNSLKALNQHIENRCAYPSRPPLWAHATLTLNKWMSEIFRLKCKE